MCIIFIISRHSDKHILRISLCYSWNAAVTTTQIKLLALAHCGLYATSCTLSACRAMEQPSHRLVPASYASRYLATSGSSHISKIWIWYSPRKWRNFEFIISFKAFCYRYLRIISHWYLVLIYRNVDFYLESQWLVSFCYWLSVEFIVHLWNDASVWRVFSSEKYL